MSLARSGSHRLPHTHLDDVPTRPPEGAFEFLDDLAVASNQSVQALQVAVDHEDEVVELLPAGETQCAKRLRLVAFAIAQERPHLAIAHGDEPPAVQVLHDVGLIDRLDGPQAHGYRRELPVVGHQPRVRIRGQSAAIDFLPERIQLRFVQASFQIRTRIDARGAMALEVDEVARLGRRWDRGRSS